MNRVVKLLTLLCICTSCVNRTENTNFSAKVSAVLEVPEMVVSGNDMAGIGNTGKNTYSEDVSTCNDRETVTEAVFYIFDENGGFVSKSSFAGAESYGLDLPKNGNYMVYVLCNMSALINMPETPTKSEIESLTLPHRDRYDYLPFAGKAYVTVAGDNPTVKIALTRINSAILIENRSTDRVELIGATVTGLPSRGNIFDTGTEATDVTYSESAEADIDANGNAVVYSFFVPEEQMESVKIEAEATVKDNTDESANTATALASLSFIDRLEAGKQATALVGYTGDLRIGSPENWGNVGLYELCGDIRLSIIGSEFFDYKNAKALRAYSGGSEFSFTVDASEGAASLEITDGSAGWVEIKSGTITVSPNTGTAERECQVAVKVGGNNVGIFHIVQGKGITFSCTNTGVTFADNRIERVGGTGSSAAVYTVSFDISDDELDGMEIVPENNGADGISVDINRIAKTISCHFMISVDAAEVSAEGVSVPVRFVDVNGHVNATLEVVQRPTEITFDPTRYPNVSYQGGDITATVTTEGDSRWSIRSITDKSGATLGSSGTWLVRIAPSTTAASGSDLELEVTPNGTSSSRIAYVVVQSNFTYSKPYQITQAPSYGLKNISANVGWDAATNTLKTYSKGSTYSFNFETETAVPNNVTLAVDCDPTGSGKSVITASAITNTSGNNYSFTLTVPDSDNADKEVTGDIDITASGITIGSFTVKRAYKPSFISVTEEVWGGVKNRPELKKGTYRASEWDLKDFTSSNGNITVTKTSGQEIEVAYAEMLAYDDEAQTATISMNLNGGNKVEYNTTQKPVAFTVSATDLAKLKNVSKDATRVDITVNAQASSATSWHVASSSADWLTTDPEIGGTETNASGSTLTVKFAANTTGDRTGSFVIESLNTTSPAYEVSQNGAFSATVTSVLYNGSNSAVFADGMLKAFSTAYDYTFNITANNAVAGDKLSVVSKTSGTAVTIETQPSGTALATAHSFVISVPASTLATEPESLFDIMADGNRIGGFTVKQAKKPSISVSTATVIGGSAPIGGSFTASIWDIKSSGYVISDNTDMAITLPSSNNGTFTVGMAASMNQSFTNRSATIALVGVTGNLATCSIAQNKVLYAFSPTSVSATAAGGSSEVTVTSSNAGTISSGMTATSSQTWCTVSVSGNKVTVNIAANTGDKRTANVYVTYMNCQSLNFTVTQESAYDPLATVTIGGIQWTRYNLANPVQASGGATFATKLPSQCSGNRSESHGRIYQWNRNVSWNSTGSSVSGATPSGSWYTTNPSGTSWSTSPCPSGYRLPKDTEYQTLISSCDVYYLTGTWSSSNYGYIRLTDKTNSNNQLEFVAVGSRNYDSSGTLGEDGTIGNYWTSVQYTTDLSYLLYFNNSSVSVTDRTKRRGFSVRCVRQ